MSGQIAVARAQATAGDPRRPDLVHAFVHREAGEKDKMPNGTLLLALLCGMAAFLLKTPYFNWLALIFVCSAAARADRNFEYSQLIQTLMFNLLGLGSAYFVPGFSRAKVTAVPPPAKVT